MDQYIEGKELYGDDFEIENIIKWFKEEEEGYSELLGLEYNEYEYEFHIINQVHGYSKIPLNIQFDEVLGFGSAYGNEFESIIHRINSLTIIEPSDKFRREFIGKIFPKYFKPRIDGSIEFENETFDLITCFGVLHHIPNVSHVLRELIRVLKPNGYLLLREPIISMGDWRNKRPNLTKNERGIPVNFFDNLLKSQNVKIISKDYCILPPGFLKRTIGRFYKKNIYTYKSFILFDKFLSKLLRFNVKYNATKKVNKFAPQAISYVIQKTLTI